MCPPAENGCDKLAIWSVVWRGSSEVEIVLSLKLCPSASGENRNELPSVPVTIDLMS
jgi:hypothetical protein